ncbi:putative baseplate assembly protein [Micromonospora sp. WMMA1363]|uniref:putative baseplate assembly protein n=1 Tax=Micromonospora sp. WMMA1363 TaxID=3053985 RepID=UPI00259CEFC7|nr:putative baseplate assembly protein [Micromonospora sp. WMMA1363]MDM4722257.1 putative baseplate assembly protein [Micromonospora sp. WMMA1363]
MTLPVPRLDDRTFLDLVTEARERIRQSCPDWTDLSVHDPGTALLEAFAYLTEVMIFRLNQLPDKAFVVFLNLLGVTRHPPTAAWADVRFTRTGSDKDPIRIPAGTRVTAGRGADSQQITFVTTEPARIPAGQPGRTVRMYHCEMVEAELLGTGTGQPGQVLRAAHPPLTRTTEPLDLLVGVEVPVGSVAIGAAAREYDGRTYEIWLPVDSFAGVGPHAKVYLVDRSSGTVTFAPALDIRTADTTGGRPGPAAPHSRSGATEAAATRAAAASAGTGAATSPPASSPAPEDGPRPAEPAPPSGMGVPATAGPESGGGTGAPGGPVTLAAVPPDGCQVRAWYRTGGGADGNVAAGTLTSLRDPLPGLKVTNPDPASGGRDLEPMESALTRGPYDFFSQQRAVTARDYEVLATEFPAIARARAFTRAAVYSFAKPGEVEVVLVPYVPDQAQQDDRLPVGVLRAHEGDQIRRQVEVDLSDRRSLGTSCRARWAQYKPVSVRGRVVVSPEEDIAAVRDRIHTRLYQTLSPLPTPLNPTGWAFGEPLRASNAYRLLEQAEPGVRYVASVQFVVDEAPDAQVRSVARDRYQAETWYAARGSVLFRSTNDGAGWEPTGRFAGETVVRIVPAPAPTRPGIVRRPGSVAAITARDSGGSGVYLSDDLGETWSLLTDLDSHVQDLAWLDRDGTGNLVLATDSGLFEVSLVLGSVPLQILVDPGDADRNFYAVSAFVSEQGAPGVAVAAQAGGGVYLSTTAGRPGTFRKIGLDDVDNRVLAVQYDGPATMLWSGAAEPDPRKPGQGCHRTRLFETDVKWHQIPGWTGGTCRDLTFADSVAVAATQSGGVLRLDTLATQARWQAVTVNSGLPLRDRTRFAPVEAIAATAGVRATRDNTPGADAGGGAGELYMVAGERGVYRSADAISWTASANQTSADVVTIPDTWLLCSGEHDIEVVRHDAPSGD